MRRFPHITSVLIGVTIAVVLGWAKDAVLWEQAIPSRLTCVVRSADGCIAWADPERVRRYTSAKAGR